MTLLPVGACSASNTACAALGQRCSGSPQPPTPPAFVPSALNDDCCGRRAWLASVAGAAGGFVAAAAPRPARAKCTNLDECRDQGDLRFQENERQKGPIISLGNGVRFRESVVGSGSEIVEKGDVVDVRYEVRKTNGDYIYSFGLGRPDMPKDDYGESLRVQLGDHNVPAAVELALEGMRVGGVRTVEMPPSLGFQTSGWEPSPTNFSGKQRMDRYRALLTGNGLQKGYKANILFEVEVVRIRPTSRSASPARG